MKSSSSLESSVFSLELHSLIKYIFRNVTEKSNALKKVCIKYGGTQFPGTLHLRLTNELLFYPLT